MLAKQTILKSVYTCKLDLSLYERVDKLSNSTS